MGKASNWTNQDGLVVGFGARTAEVNSAAKVSLGGKRQQVVFKIKASELADTDVASQLVNGVVIPAGALLESAKLYVTTAFVGATATMDVGTYLASTGVAVNAAGIFAATAVAALGANAVVTGAGALIGTVLASNQKIGATYNTAAFTQGEANVVVEYIY